MAAGAGWRKGRSWALLSVRHTLPKHHISRMRARATRRCLQHSVGAAARERSRERRCVKRAGDGAGGSSSDGAGGGSSEAGRVLEGDEKGEKSHTQADRQVRRQGDVIYRGTDCACAAGLIPACSSTSGATRRRPASS